MSNNRTIKEKLLAILACILLFAFVAALLFHIGVYNKQRTDTLQAEVRAQKAIAKHTAELASLKHFTLTEGEVSSKSHLSLVADTQGFRKVLNQKDSEKILPIASVTKLMSALVVWEHIKLDTTVVATGDFVGGDGTLHVVEIGKVYSARELLNNMLISSDNDSAQLLSSIVGVNNFVILMNGKAQELGMTNTHFVNVTGLDPLQGPPTVNTSTAKDLANLVIHINLTYPKIFEITRKDQYDFCSVDKICKPVLSTNKLLTDPEFKKRIVGGKTGQTDLALKNLALIMQPFGDIFLINIVLGSTDHFADMKTLVSKINK